MSRKIGSLVPSEQSSQHISPARILAIKGIMVRHKLSPSDIEQIKGELSNTSFSDLFFNHPVSHTAIWR